MLRRVFTNCKTCKIKFKRETHKQRICSVCREINIIKGQERFKKNNPWEILKTLIKRRDGFKCKICQSTKDLDIHHWDKNRTNNKTENLVTLCNTCHNGLHALYRKRGIK